MTLREYLSAVDLTDEEFAVRVSCSRTTISKLRNGKSNPSVALIRRVRAATGGTVSGEEWIRG